MTMSPQPHFKQILVAVDTSKQAEWAAQLGGQLAEQLFARIVLLNVVEPTMPVDGDIIAAERIEAARRQQGMDLLVHMRSAIPHDVCIQCLQRIGFPSEEIIAEAQERHVDLIVVGTRGRGRLAQLVLGSTAEAVIRHAPCPVITVAHKPESTKPESLDWVGVGADSADPISAHAR